MWGFKMYSYDFKEKYRKQTDTFYIVKYENSFYELVLYYFGDYLLDSENGFFDERSLTVAINAKGNNIDLSYIKGEIFVNDYRLSDFSIYDAQKIKSLLTISSKCAEYIMNKINKFKGC